MNTAQKLACALLFVSLNMLYSQPQILGPLQVCGGCHEYTVQHEATGEERYEWGVSIGDDFVISVGTSKDVMICWDELLSNSPGGQRLSLIVSVLGSDDEFSLEATVNIQNPTSISIIPIDVPSCISDEQDPIDFIPCQKVCSYSHYFL